MQEGDRIYIIAAIIAAVSTVLLFVPSSVFWLSFSGISFLAGEVWRIVTFPFVHNSSIHFLENIVTLALASVLARFSGLENKEALAAFFLSGILVAVMDVAFFPTLVIAGASLGIFAVLGAVSAKGTDFIPHYLLFAVLFSAVFFKYLVQSAFEGSFAGGILLNQTGLHLCGFFSGIIILYILELNTHNKRVLQWKE